jgi:hypothetical protein
MFAAYLDCSTSEALRRLVCSNRRPAEPGRRPLPAVTLPGTAGANVGDSLLRALAELRAVHQYDTEIERKLIARGFPVDQVRAVMRECMS